MSIKVQTNKNVIFFQLLLVLISDEGDQMSHPLANKIVEKFKYIKGFPIYKEFVNTFLQKNIPQNQWDYLLFSLYTTNQFTLLDICIQDEYISGIYKIYKRKIYPLVRNIYFESKFDEIYNKEFKPLYENICINIQQELDSLRPEKILLKFWQLDPKTDIYLIPNLFRVGGGSGLSINENFYAVIGASNCNGEILFKSTNMISTIYHEFSHSFFKDAISQNEILKERNKEICKSLGKVILKKVPKDIGILQNYGISTTYFEETFMRAIQIFLSYEFFKQIYTNSNSLKMDTEKKLDARESEGFIFIKMFFDSIKKYRNKEPIGIYYKTLVLLSKQ